MRPSAGTHVRILTVPVRQRTGAPDRPSADRGGRRPLAPSLDPPARRLCRRRHRGAARPGGRALCARADASPDGGRRGDHGDGRPQPPRRDGSEGRARPARAAPSTRCSPRSRSSVEAQRRLVSDASHELRTPLTSLRTNVALLGRPNALRGNERKRVLADVDAEIEELTRLVTDVVDLARDGEPQLAVEDVRLDLVVADAVERARRHAPGRHLHDDARGVGRARAPERAPPRGRRTSSTTPPSGARRAGRSTWPCTADAVTVRDHGPGIPDGGPAARLRPLLPRDGSPRNARLRARPRNRPPGGGVARRPGVGRAAEGGGTIFRLVFTTSSLGAFQEPLSKRCFDAGHGDDQAPHEAHVDRCNGCRCRRIGAGACRRQDLRRLRPEGGARRLRRIRREAARRDAAAARGRVQGSGPRASRRSRQGRPVSPRRRRTRLRQRTESGDFLAPGLFLGPRAFGGPRPPRLRAARLRPIRRQARRGRAVSRADTVRARDEAPVRPVPRGRRKGAGQVRRGPEDRDARGRQGQARSGGQGRKC